MPKSSQFNGEILHFNAVRLRVTGSGNLQQTISSLGYVNEFEMPVLAMSSRTNRELVTLADYKDQMGSLILKTTEIDETFSISKIVIFVKPIASGYPL